MRDRPSWLTQAEKVAPLYRAPTAGPASRAGQGHGSDGSGSARIRQAASDGSTLEIEVSSGRAAPSAFLEHTMFQRWIHAAFPFPVTFPVAVTAERWEAPGLVDGAALPFVFVGEPSCWVASATLPDGRQVQVTAHGLPSAELSLEQLDPGTVT